MLSAHVVGLFTPVNFNRHNVVMTPPHANGAMLVRGVTGTVARGRPSTCLVMLLVSRHPRRIASVRHGAGTRIISSAFSRTPRHRTRITRVIVRVSGHVMRSNGSIVVLLSSVAHLTHTCGALRPGSKHVLSNNISTVNLRGPGHFFNTTHGVRGNKSLAVVTATLVSANDHVSRIVFRRFGNANGVRLILSHVLTSEHVCPTVSIRTSKAHGRSLLVRPSRLTHV